MIPYHPLAQRHIIPSVCDQHPNQLPPATGRKLGCEWKSGKHVACWISGCLIWSNRSGQRGLVGYEEKTNQNPNHSEDTLYLKCMYVPWNERPGRDHHPTKQRLDDNQKHNDVRCHISQKFKTKRKDDDGKKWKECGESCNNHILWSCTRKRFPGTVEIFMVLFLYLCDTPCMRWDELIHDFLMTLWIT